MSGEDAIEKLDQDTLDGRFSFRDWCEVDQPLYDIPGEELILGLCHEVDAIRAERDLIAKKLRRVRDLFKFHANSQGGIVAEIDELIPEEGSSEGEGGTR